jgi:hypothetical protein
MYIEDLFKFDFGNEINIGWLSKDHEFKKGKIINSEEFLDHLNNYYKHAVSQTRGSHSCEFCDRKSEDFFVKKEIVPMK